MAITLGELRTYCRNIGSPNSSGSTAESNFMVWINAAIQRVFSETNWSKTSRKQRLTVPPEESGTTMNVTQGSLTVSVDVTETLEDKYVTDAWEIEINGETNHGFVLGSKTDDQNATFQTGDEWIQATATNQSWTARQTTFDLPDNALEVTRVQEHNTGRKITYMSPDQFDTHKDHQGSAFTGDAYFYTIRNSKLELYPHPGANYLKLSLTYTLGPTFLEDAALDTEVIVWEDHLRELLLKAVQLEASFHQGEDHSPIKLESAMALWTEALKRWKAKDHNKARASGPIRVQHYGVRGRNHGSKVAFINTGATTIPDA